MRRTSAFIAVMLCVTGGGVRAQDAIVLSGGGSRGLAHAGVLIALDSLGYDPDIVVGTSMGAVVGALYAAGHDAKAVRDRLARVAWAELFSPTLMVAGPARDARAPSFSLDLDLDAPSAGRGLVGQWRINRALVHLLFDAEARSRGDFDRLPRRYRAVAADLQTGDAVILGSGDLARAARASMAVPGFFAPIAWEDRILVDGGIADNLPVATARMLGATHVIASDVSRPPAQIHSQAPFAVIGRALDLMQENMRENSIPPDVLLLPAIDPSLTGAVFPRNPGGLFRIGFAAATDALPPAPLLRRGEARVAPAPPASFSNVTIEAGDSALAALARGIFRPLVGSPYDARRVASAVDRLYSTGLFEGVWPRVEDSGAADPELVVRLEALPPLALGAAANYDNDRGGRAWLSLDRYTPIAGLPATATLATSLGGLERWGALSARLHATTNSPIVWSGGTYLSEADVRSFPEDGLTQTQIMRTGGWIAIELPQILDGRLATATVHAERIEIEDGKGGFSAGPIVRYTSGVADPSVVGLPVLVELERRWGAATYTRWTLAGSTIYARRGLQIALLGDLRAVSASAPLDVHPALGDGHAMPGFRWGEERGAARAVAGADVAQDFLNGYMRLRLRAGSVALAWDDWEGAEWRLGAQVGGVWQTPVGAVEVGYGVNSRGDGRFDVSIGRDF